MMKSAKLMTVAMLLAASTALGQADAAAGKDKQPQKEKQVEAKKLTVGDRAPELAIQTWVKGEPITGFEKGRVYVVEFWATWCGPCIVGMPHLTELQKEYKDKGVRIIGVNAFDDPAKVAPFMTSRGDDLMGYTVAIEKKDDEANTRNGVMAKTWMDAAGRKTIPSAFIVDQKGAIAWIGSPSQMDIPLREVVAGTWTPERATRYEAEQKEAAAASNSFRQAYMAGNYDEAFEIARKHAGTTWKDDWQMQNTVAWYLVDPAKPVPDADLDLALRAANRANDLTKGENAMVLDTVARVYFLKGDVANALKLQTKAVELNTEEQIEAELQTRLEEYQKASK